MGGGEFVYIFPEIILFPLPLPFSQNGIFSLQLPLKSPRFFSYSLYFRSTFLFSSWIIIFPPTLIFFPTSIFKFLFSFQNFQCPIPSSPLPNSLNVKVNLIFFPTDLINFPIFRHPFGRRGRGGWKIWSTQHFFYIPHDRQCWHKLSFKV